MELGDKETDIDNGDDFFMWSFRASNDFGEL